MSADNYIARFFSRRNFQVRISDVQIRGVPESLHPGEPHCASAAVVISEFIAALLRTLHADRVWNPAVNSAIVDRLQHVDSLSDLLSHARCRGDSVVRDSVKLVPDRDADCVEKTVSVGDEVIETVGRKEDSLSGVLPASELK